MKAGRKRVKENVKQVGKSKIISVFITHPKCADQYSVLNFVKLAYSYEKKYVSCTHTNRW